MASVAYNIYLASEGFYVLRSGVLAVLGCGDGCGHMWRTPQIMYGVLLLSNVWSTSVK